MKRIQRIGLLLSLIAAGISTARLEACGPAPVCAPRAKVAVAPAVVATNTVIIQQPLIVPSYFVQYNPLIYAPSINVPSFQPQLQYGPAADPCPSDQQAEYKLFLKLKARYGSMPCPPGCEPKDKGSGSGSAGDGSGSTTLLPEKAADIKRFNRLVRANCASCHSYDKAARDGGGFAMTLADGSDAVFSPPEMRDIADRLSRAEGTSGHMPKQGTIDKSELEWALGSYLKGYVPRE